MAVPQRHKKCGVVKSLIHDIIVGRDFPLFIELWNQVQTGLPGQPRGLGTLGIERPKSEGSDPEPPTTHTPNADIPIVNNEVAENVNLVDNVHVSGLKTELTSEGEVSSLQVMLGGMKRNFTHCRSRLRRMMRKLPLDQCTQTWMYPGVRLALLNSRILL